MHGPFSHVTYANSKVTASPNTCGLPHHHITSTTITSTIITSAIITPTTTTTINYGTTTATTDNNDSTATKNDPQQGLRHWATGLFFFSVFFYLFLFCFFVLLTFIYSFIVRLCVQNRMPTLGWWTGGSRRVASSPGMFLFISYTTNFTFVLF